MKNIAKLLSAATAAFVLASSASALTISSWEDRDPNDGTDPELLREDYNAPERLYRRSYDLNEQTHSGTFHIGLDGFDTATNRADKIEAWFAFADHGNSSGSFEGGESNDIEEWVNIWVGGVKVWTGEVDGYHNEAYDVVYMDLTGIGGVITDLFNNPNGQVSYFLEIDPRYSDSNRDHDYVEDTYLKWSKMVVTQYDRCEVPDAGATVALLGLGLLGLAAARKRLK